MPHRIEITGIRAERLQDISYEDCLAEGIFKIGNTSTYTYFATGILEEPDTPQKVYAKLINRISGKGTWQRNPLVWVYEFKLVD